MAIEYLGLSEVNGPLVVLEGVKNASYEEIVEFTVDGNEKKLGRIVAVYEDKAVIQVFEGTSSMSLTNTHTRLTGHPMEIGLSEEILGRTFDGIGKPIDRMGPIDAEVRRNVNGLPLNPVTRKYPRNYIHTGISAIDGSDHPDSWPEAADLLRKRTSARPAGSTDRTAGIPWRF